MELHLPLEPTTGQTAEQRRAFCGLLVCQFDGLPIPSEAEVRDALEGG